MTQPTPSPENNFAGHNMIPTIPGFSTDTVRPRLTESDMRYDIAPNAVPSQSLARTADGRLASDPSMRRHTIGIETMLPTLQLNPQLPKELDPVSNKIALLWKSDEIGLLVTQVGVHISLNGRDVDKWWMVQDSKGKDVPGVSPENAMPLYEKLVFPYLKEVFEPVLREYAVRKAELALAATLA